MDSSFSPLLDLASRVKSVFSGTRNGIVRSNEILVANGDSQNLVTLPLLDLVQPRLNKYLFGLTVPEVK